MTRLEKLREYLAKASPEHAARMLAKAADRQCHICVAFDADGPCKNITAHGTCVEGIEAWLLEEVETQEG